MSHEHDDLDEALHRHFSALREADRRDAPSFEEMIARARADVAAGQGVAGSDMVAGTRRRHPWRRMALAAPVAAAAAVAAIWLAPGRAADREFERAVSEWSRTERTLDAPTDALLRVPGSEYLRRLPALGAGAGISRRPS